MNTRPIKDRFWEKVNKTEGCWEWTASQRGTGYGSISVGPNMVSAHRVSYQLHFGNIPEGQHVLHSCDNRLCVRPDHLFLGTNQDNVDDKMKKGRHFTNAPCGEDSGPSKLTEAMVREIRKNYKPFEVTQSSLAKLYGVHQSVVARVLSNKTWRHVR